MDIKRLVFARLVKGDRTVVDLAVDLGTRHSNVWITLERARLFGQVGRVRVRRQGAKPIYVYHLTESGKKKLRWLRDNK